MLLHPSQLDPKGSLPLYQQIIDGIKEEMNSGRLPQGARLPSIRKLAEELGLSRITVENAYLQLSEEGYLASKPKSGYFATDLQQLSQSPVRETRRVLTEADPPVLFNFQSNSVDARSLDTAVWRRYVNQALKSPQVLSSYGHSQGEPILRQVLANYSFNARDVRCSPEQIVVGAGVQSLLHILCGLIKSQVHRIGIQNPGFTHAEQVFQDHGLTTGPFALDQPWENQAYDLVCINPSNPYAGGPLSAARRLALVRWAQEKQVFILEDDYIGEFRYLMRPVPSLQGMSNGDYILYLGSFSRTLMPSLRISYMVLPPSLLPAYEAFKDKYNQTSSSIEQLALAGFIADGHLRRHIRRLRKLYAHKSQLLQKELQRQLGKRVTITSYESGLRLLVLVQAPVKAEVLAEKAQKKGVAVIPVPSESSSGEGRSSRSQIMLSYAGIPEEDIPQAVATLASAWKDLL